uniref:Uncharacterized protein n=1 Tax=Rhizophora mucronata TaxID=61149 RepID=A0A2P2IP67_RHIMU
MIGMLSFFFFLVLKIIEHAHLLALSFPSRPTSSMVKCYTSTFNIVNKKKKKSH